MFTLSHEALETMTRDQQVRLLNFHPDRVDTVTISKASIDLPTGYLYVIVKYGNGGPVIHGGISPEGDMST